MSYYGGGPVAEAAGQIQHNLKETNRKLDDLIAAVLTLACIQQVEYNRQAGRNSDDDDPINTFGIIRDLIEDRK